MRRYIALTITALMALALAPFGVAEASHELGHEEIVVDVTKPTAGSVAGTIDVAVSITESYGGDSPVSLGIASYKVEIQGADGFAATLCEETFVNEQGEPAPRQGSVNLAFTWKTSRYPNGAPATNCDGGNPELPNGGENLFNGEFTIVASAEMQQNIRGERPSDSDSVAIGVNNIPATATGVALSYKTAKDQITVSWNANPEASYDAIAYRVQECRVNRSSKPCDSSDWSTVDDVTATSITVKRTKPGIYRYRVVSLRLNAAETAWLTASAAATPQSDPTEIQVEEDPDPTTTTTAPEEVNEEPAEPETRTVVKPTRRVQRAAPQVLQRIVEEDPGFEDELPYDEDEEEAISGLPIDGNSEDGGGQRAVLIPLAGGALLLVFAMQVHYLNRRASSALERVPVEALDSGDRLPDDWND